MAGRMAQVVEGLLSRHEAQCSNPNTTKKKKKRQMSNNKKIYNIHDKGLTFLNL
jgi:hypothetical protein